MALSTPLTVPTFRLPDLISYCARFPVRYHKNGDAISEASTKWFLDGCPHFSDKQRHNLQVLKAGQLVAYCYPDCDDDRLRIGCDIMNFLFHYDDLSDPMVTIDTEILADMIMNALWFPDSYHPTHTKGKEQPEEEIHASRLTRDFWSRCIKDAGPGVQARFRESIELFIKAIGAEARDREKGATPDLRTYIQLRRDSSGVKPCFDLLEYTLHIDLPGFVIEDPAIKALKQTCDDFVAWANDLFSYNIEQSRGDTHNMVAVFMTHDGLDLQEAVDRVGDMCREAVDTFCEIKKNIPSWGPEIDKDVAAYVRGLEDWISGSTHWSFACERYFPLEKIAHIRETRMVEVLPRRVNANAA